MTGQTCRVCGCVDERIMPTCFEFSGGRGCHWVEADLCSTCAELLRHGVAEGEIRRTNARELAMGASGA